MEYPVEEDVADMVVETLREGIDVNKIVITDKHELHQKLLSANALIEHLDETIPTEQDHVHVLNQILMASINNLIEFIETNELYDIGFVKEEKEDLEKIELDIDHKEWKVIHKDIHKEVGDEDEHIKTEAKYLHGLHRAILNTAILMRKSKLLSALDEDLENKKEKKEYAKKEIHYFLEIYHFLKTYEHILRHLLIKEGHRFNKLNRKLKV